MEKYVGIIEVMAEPMTFGKAVEKGFIFYDINNGPLTEEQFNQVGYIIEHANSIYQWLDKETFDSHYAKVDSAIDKLYVERKQVADRLQKLCMFTSKQNFNELVPDVEERKLLLYQQAHMNEYLSALNQRIKLYYTHHK